MTQKTEIGRCRDCKWWGDVPLSKETLLKSVHDEKYHDLRFCPKTNLQAWFNVHGKMYYGVLATMPDFGCIHWEEKE